MARDLHAGLPVVRRLALAAFVLVPSAAQACAVCGGGPGRNAMAFVGTTIFLSLLPLGMIGAGLWWTRRNLWSSLAGDPGSPDERGVGVDAVPVVGPEATAPGGARGPTS